MAKADENEQISLISIENFLQLGGEVAYEEVQELKVIGDRVPSWRVVNEQMRSGKKLV